MSKTMENEMEAGLHGGFRGTIYNVMGLCPFHNFRMGVPQTDFRVMLIIV